MDRTILIVVVALTVLVAGCGGPGDAPEDEDLPEEDPDDPAEDPDDPDEGPDDPDEGPDDEGPSIDHSSLTSLAGS